MSDVPFEGPRCVEGRAEGKDCLPGTPGGTEARSGDIVELKGKEAGHIAQATAIIAEDGAVALSLEALLSIPGIGPITAITLLALFRKYCDANRRQIVALAGLDPIQFQSGTSVHRKSRISKRGNREVRKRLYEATLSAARYNPAVKHLYRRLKDAGKPDKVARIAGCAKAAADRPCCVQEQRTLPRVREGSDLTFNTASDTSTLLPFGRTR